jgi:uncharacterized protein YdeI (YjbR/CyaY-like superfamily)
MAKEVYAASRAAWRGWLIRNHARLDNVWLVYTRETAGGKLTYADIVEEALCFGWIDSIAGSVDARRTKLYMSKRKPTSGWAKSNKERVARLRAAGLMTPAGLRVVEAAKLSGAWTRLDAAENLQMPGDLRKALAAAPDARRHFDNFPPGSKKIIYQWILQAKRPETRAKRVAETVTMAKKNLRANHYRQPNQRKP